MLKSKLKAALLLILALVVHQSSPQLLIDTQVQFPYSSSPELSFPAGSSLYIKETPQDINNFELRVLIYSSFGILAKVIHGQPVSGDPSSLEISYTMEYTGGYLFLVLSLPKGLQGASTYYYIETYYGNQFQIAIREFGLNANRQFSTTCSLGVLKQNITGTSIKITGSSEVTYDGSSNVVFVDFQNSGGGPGYGIRITHPTLEFGIYRFSLRCQGCNNGVKESGEQCDTQGDTAGCVNCIKQAGYDCTEDVYLKSTCSLADVCGDSKRGLNEVCDNGNNTGCLNCQQDLGYICSGDVGTMSACQINTSDGIKLPSQECDAGPNKPGCINGKISVGYKCDQNDYTISLCYYICGDGIRAAEEQCDNGNQTGCIGCKIAPGYTCAEDSKHRSVCAITCGDGIVGKGETCDNGNQLGCSANCLVDRYYTCTSRIGQMSVCTGKCGDSYRTADEACDNGKLMGCSTCTIVDAGYTCTGEVGQKSRCKKTIV